MSLLPFLYSLSNTQLIILLSFVFVVGSLALLTIFRALHFHTGFHRDNTAIGSAGTMIGMIYGVLVGIAALYLINNISFTAEAVQHEATASDNLFRDSNVLPPPYNAKIQTIIKSYLKEVIFQEWPAMKAGKPLSNQGGQLIDSLTQEVNFYRISHAHDALLVHDMYEDIKSLNNARAQRIHMNTSQLNAELWGVILVGTILVIIINFFLKMSFKLHLATMAATSLMTSAMIFLLITLDSPFQGDFVIEPDSLTSVLEHMERK